MSPNLKASVIGLTQRASVHLEFAAILEQYSRVVSELAQENAVLEATNMSLKQVNETLTARVKEIERQLEPVQPASQP